MLPAKRKSTTAPDFTACHPNTVWKSSGSRNGAAPTAIQKTPLPRAAAPNVGIRSVRRLISGAGVRRRWRIDATSASVETAPIAANCAHGVRASATRCAAQVSPASPAPVSTTPTLSSGGGVPNPSRDSISRHAMTNASTPSGALIRNSQRQLA